MITGNEAQNQRRAPRVVDGKSLLLGVPQLPKAPISVPTQEGAINLRDDGILDGHILVLGGIGQGKSNVIYHLLDCVQATMGNNDVAVIFDPKGDYLRFRRPGDIVINDPAGEDEQPWNLLAELAAAGGTKAGDAGVEDREETASEIAHTLFDEANQRTQQIFFPMAAMQLFAATLRHPEMLLGGSDDVTKLSNASIVRYWNERSQEQIAKDLQRWMDTKGLAHYISSEAPAQSMGVLSQIVQVVGDVFLGRFRDPGTFSIREAVRNRGGHCIFIEYRIRAGRALAPLYRILIDLAIKEALTSPLPANGRVYLFLDEFRLLPRLMHLDNGVSFGREFGLRFIAGMQTHNQVKVAFGDEAESILASFNTVFAFRTANPDTRTFIQGITGHNKKLYIHSVIPGQTLQQIEDGQVIEDYHVWDLQKGQAIVFLPNQEPFIAKIELHPKKRG